MLNDLIKWDGSGRATLLIRVTPKASANRIRIEQHPTGPRVRVDVPVAPEDGKANKHGCTNREQNYRVSKNMNIADNLSFSR